MHVDRLQSHMTDKIFAFGAFSGAHILRFLGVSQCSCSRCRLNRLSLKVSSAPFFPTCEGDLLYPRGWRKTALPTVSKAKRRKHLQIILQKFAQKFAQICLLASFRIATDAAFAAGRFDNRSLGSGLKKKAVAEGWTLLPAVVECSLPVALLDALRIGGGRVWTPAPFPIATYSFYCELFLGDFNWAQREMCVNSDDF